MSTAADDDATTSVICSGLIIVWYASIAENPATIIDSIKLTAKIAIISLRFIGNTFLLIIGLTSHDVAPQVRIELTQHLPSGVVGLLD